MLSTRKTKIICTLGPAVDNEDTIRTLIRTGMDAARFNFSHGSHEEHLARLTMLKSVRDTMGRAVATILDTKGPEIRIRTFAGKSVTLEAGDEPADFCRRAKAQSAAQTDFITGGPWDADQLVYFTCLPWFPVTALKNEKDLNPSDSVPRAAWGRWQEEGDRTTLLVSLELNHRLLDGVHVGKFYEALNGWMRQL